MTVPIGLTTEEATPSLLEAEERREEIAHLCAERTARRAEVRRLGATPHGLAVHAARLLRRPRRSGRGSELRPHR